MHDGTAGDDTILQVLHTETFQRLRLEMRQEFLSGGLLGEDPVIQLKGTILGTKVLLKLRLHGTIIKHLFRLEVAHQLLHIVGRTLTGEEFSRRDVEEAYATSSLAEMDGSEEVVLLIVQDVVAHRHAWSHQFGDATLHHLVHLAQAFLALDFLSLLLWVFQLVAYSHTLASSDELRQIGIEGVMRESCHLRTTSRTAIVSAGQRDAEHFGSLYRIFAISFVEVATTEKQQCFGVLGFHLEELSHHRRKTFIIVCHCLIILYLLSRFYIL